MMINLFKLDDKEVVVEPEALLLAPYKALWDRDKSDSRYLAKQELAYVYFMGDPRSEYNYITDKEVRSQQVIQGLGMPKGWKPDKAIDRAIDFYNSFIPTSAALVNDAREGMNKMREMIKNTDWEAKDDDGKFINSPDTLPKLLNQLPKLILAYNEAEKTLYSDIKEDIRARGSQEKALFEDE